MKSKIACAQSIVFVGVALMFSCSQASAKSPGAVASAKKAVKPASAAAKSHEGPFGLEKGISGAELVSSLGFVRNDDISPFSYSGTPPKPVDDLDTYDLIVTPKAGLCRISAREDVKVVNGSGDQLKAAADRYAAILELKYGSNFDKSEDIREDVYRRNPHFWMQGLQEKSVSYRYLWSNADSALPYQLKRVIINVTATDITRGYVTVSYDFDNASECVAEMQAHKASSM